MPVNRPLFNLLAARFLIADVSAAGLGSLVSRDMKVLWEDGTIRVYENASAWPRALKNS